MPPLDPAAARARSCLLGGILGDAMGSAHEGAAPGHAAAIREPAPTDDTQLTLATCEALLDRDGEVDPEAIAQAFVRWFRAGWLSGLGSSTLKALRDLAAGMHWALSGAQGDRTAGNGAAMRIAPVALLVDPTSAAGRRTIQDIARITHRHDEAGCGALAQAVALRLAFDGRWAPGKALVGTVADALPDCAVRDRMLTIRAMGHAPIAAIADLGTSGHVVDSVALAIAAAERLGDRPLRDALGAVIACGGDTDTNASMAGQILGCVRTPHEAEPASGFSVGRGQVGDAVARFAGLVARRATS